MLRTARPAAELCGPERETEKRPVSRERRCVRACVRGRCSPMRHRLPPEQRAERGTVALRGDGMAESLSDRRKDVDVLRKVRQFRAWVHARRTVLHTLCTSYCAATTCCETMSADGARQSATLARI